MINSLQSFFLVAVGFFSAATFFSCKTVSKNDSVKYNIDTLIFSIPTTSLGSPNQWLVSDLLVDDYGRVVLQNLNRNEMSLDRYFIETSKLDRTNLDSALWMLVNSAKFNSIHYIDSTRLAFLDMEAEQWKPQTGKLYLLDVENDDYEVIEANGKHESHSFSTISVGKTPPICFNQSFIIHSPISDISVSDSVSRPAYGSYPMELILGIRHDISRDRIGCQWTEYWNEPRPDPFPVRCLENHEQLTSMQPFSFMVKKYRFQDGSCSEFEIRSEYVSSFEKYPESKQGDTYYLRKYLDRAPAVKNIAFDKFKSLYYIAIKHSESNIDSTAWSIVVTDIDMNPVEEVAFSKGESVSWKWLLPSKDGLILVDSGSFRGELSEKVRLVRLNFHESTKE